MSNDRIAQQVKTLLRIKTSNYRVAGDGHPEIAAQFAVEGILHLYRTQAEYLEQLLDEEIDDANRAAA